MVTPVACFPAGHQTIFKQELAALDVGRRRQFFRVVGPPHEILQGWNVRVSVFMRPRAIDKVIADERAAVSRVWNDNMLPTGLEWIGQSMCALALPVDMESAKSSKHVRKKTLKHWKSFLDENGLHCTI